MHNKAPKEQMPQLCSICMLWQHVCMHAVLGVVFASFTAAYGVVRAVLSHIKVSSCTVAIFRQLCL